MNIDELKELLEGIASEDLSDGSDLHDHPCTVAIRALDQCYEDIGILRRAFKNKQHSKKVQVLLGLSYGPSY